MRNTGYTTARAAPHERAVWRVITELNHRGYPTVELAVDGHRPDARIKAGPYIEVKTGAPNLAIEVDSIECYESMERSGDVVFIVWLPSYSSPLSDWTVHTPLSARIGFVGGRRSRSGSGSNDDWYLCTHRGRPFDAVFAEENTKGFGHSVRKVESTERLGES